MASWTLTGTTTSPTYWKCRAVVTEVSQDIANNTTSLKVSLQLGRDVVSSYIYAYTTKYYINIGTNGSGNQDLATFIWDPATAGGWKEIASRTVTIAHDADGTKKNLAIAAKWFQTGVTPTEASVSGTVTLTTIPRATTPSTPISGALGDTITITLPRASNTFVHYLTYTFGGAGGTINAGTAGASCTWTIPKSLANQIPNGTSGTGTITCHTYAGSFDPLDTQKNYIGTKTVSFTVTVPNTSEFQPSCSFSIAEAVAGLNTQFGTYVQNKSKLRIQTTAAGAYSSTITRIDIFADSKQYSGDDTTTDVITSSGTLTIVVSVTDSRNRHKAVSQQISVASYSPPTGSLSGVRALQDGTADQNGEYLRYNVKFDISPVNNHNTKTVNLQYKAATDPDTAWTNVFTWTADYSKTVTGGVSASAILSANSTYNIRLKITDYFGTTYVNHGNIPTAFTLMDFYGVDGTGMAIGKVAETGNLLDVALPAKFRSDLKDGNNNYIDVFRHHVLIANGTDLDTITTPGIYTQSASNNTTNMSNIPVKSAFLLIVYPGDWGLIHQKISYLNGTEYYRYYQTWSPVGWTTWKEITGINCVVEEGTDDTTQTGIEWHYRKWANGRAECWGVYKFVPASVSSLVSGWYYAYTGTLSLPFEFKTCDYEGVCLAKVQGGGWASGNNVTPNTNKTTVQALLVQTGSSPNSNGQYIAFDIRGTWK